MAVITIPKKIIKDDDLIIIPRREYEKLLYSLKEKKIVSPFRSARIKHSLKNKKDVFVKSDKDLDKAIEEYKAREYYGPFRNAKEGRIFLEARRNEKSEK